MTTWSPIDGLSNWTPPRILDEHGLRYTRAEVMGAAPVRVDAMWLATAEQIAQAQRPRMRKLDDASLLVLGRGWLPEECEIRHEVKHEGDRTIWTDTVVVNGRDCYRVEMDVWRDGAYVKVGTSASIIEPAPWHPRHPFKPAEGACEHRTAFQCSAISGLPSCGRTLCFNCEAPVTADEVRTMMRTCRQCSSKPTEGV